MVSSKHYDELINCPLSQSKRFLSAVALKHYFPALVGMIGISTTTVVIVFALRLTIITQPYVTISLKTEVKILNLSLSLNINLL